METMEIIVSVLGILLVIGAPLLYKVSSQNLVLIKDNKVLIKKNEVLETEKTVLIEHSELIEKHRVILENECLMHRKNMKKNTDQLDKLRQLFSILSAMGGSTGQSGMGQIRPSEMFDMSQMTKTHSKTVEYDVDEILDEINDKGIDNVDVKKINYLKKHSK